MDKPWDDPDNFFRQAAWVGAFSAHGQAIQRPTETGLLTGLSVAVKDLFDWQGLPTGAGNPHWRQTHPIPQKNANVLTVLLAAGATLVGKTVTDELAYSLHGDNIHEGTPKNSAAPDRVPGGSSSGSAAAVAASLVDAALGTDTGGSVRVPASYCGLYGLRTSHGLVDRSGVVALAPSFDTVGWFARNPAVLGRLAAVLVANLPAENAWATIWTLPEAEDLTDSQSRQALGNLIQKLGLPSRPLTELTAGYGGLAGLQKIYGTIQAWEAWQTHGDWIQSAKPIFGPAVDQRFRLAAQISTESMQTARQSLQRFQGELRQALGQDGLLILPAAAGPAPKINENEAQVDAIRSKTMRLTCLSGLAALPQLTVPAQTADSLPRGVGLIGPFGTDRALIGLAAQVGLGGAL